VARSWNVGKLAAHEVADFAEGSVKVAGTLAKAAGKIAFDDMKHLINDTPVGWVAKPIAEGFKKGFKVWSSGVSDVVDDIVHINYTGIEHAVAKGFKDAGEGLKNAGEAALHGVEVVGKDIGHAATTVGKDIGHAATHFFGGNHMHAVGPTPAQIRKQQEYNRKKLWAIQMHRHVPTLSEFYHSDGF
jgi:hypothetical protein